MKQTLSFIFAIVLLVTAACKKNTQAPCPEAFSDDTCEDIADREYPLLDISQEPAAWYRATIEGQETTVGTGYEAQGFSYDSRAMTKSTTSGPVLEPTTPKIMDFYYLNFYIYNPSKEQVGKSFVLLSFLSPGFDKDTISDPMSFATSLFAPGVKKVNDGTGAIDGWDIKMDLLDNIEKTGQTGVGGPVLFTSSALQPIEDNYFEITQTTSEDLGAVVRFTIWCKFEVQMYRKRSNPTMGLYFGPIEQGTAKLYVDVAK